MSRLSSQTAIVTGASKSIGKAIAKRYAAEGADVVVNSRSIERATSAAEEISNAGGSAVGIAADVSKYEEVQRLVDETTEEFGGLDIMVNNAGITHVKHANEFDPKTWREVIDIDLNGVFFGAQIAANQMMDQEKGGAILNISSMMGGMGFKMRAPYCAAKAGVNNLTQTLAVEWAENDITVNALAPGFIYTDITDQTQTSAGYTDEDIRKRTPMERFGSLEEMAECGLFLVERNNFVTGEVLHADGGWTADAWQYWENRGEQT